MNMLKIGCFVCLTLVCFPVDVASEGNALVPRDKDPEKCSTLLNPTSEFYNLAYRNYCNVSNSPCACSCDEKCVEKHKRIQRCCIAKANDDKCWKLCRYDVDLTQLMCLAKKCVIASRVWFHCAADTQDHTQNLECCARNGVPKACDVYCRGEIPSVDSFKQDHALCVLHYGKILKCIADNLPEETSWAKQNKTFHSEKPFSDWHLNMMELYKPKNCSEYSQ